MGPDPGPGSPGARLQWSTLARVRTRSLRIDAASGFIDVLGMFAAKVPSSKPGSSRARRRLRCIT